VKPRYMIALVAAAVVCVACGCGGESGGGVDGGAGPGNHPPQLEAQRDTSVVLGDTLELWARAEDPDGHTVTYGLIVPLSLEELLSGYSPDAHIRTDGRFLFVPVTEDGHVRAFRFTAEDDFGGSDLEQFQVNITGRSTGSSAALASASASASFAK